MAHYRKIDSRIWNDEKFTSLSDRAQLCFFFLLTHPNTTMLGTLRGTITGLASELFAKQKKSSSGLLEGFGEALLEGYTEAFREVIAKGLARYDDRACLLWFPNFLKYNPPESPNVIRAWPRAYDLVPECELKHSIYARLEEYTKGLTEAFTKAFAEAFGKPLPKGIGNQKQEQEQNINPTHTASQYEFPSKPETTRSVIADLPISKGKTYPYPKSEAEKLGKLYPGVNVEQEFRAMSGWLGANPKRRKTAAGIPRFVNAWLKRAHDELPKGKGAAAASGKSLVGSRKQQGDGSFKL